MGFAEHYLSGMMQSSAAVLGRHGYEHVKAEELARSVGMSVGSLYRRYMGPDGVQWAWSFGRRDVTSGRLLG